MFDGTELKVLELAGKGYCCTQIMVLLALEEMGRDNPDLVRSAAGLCNGLGDCSGPCGVMTGGLLLLGLYGGKGADMEEAEESLPLMLEGFRDWFVDTTEQYGGITCGEILDGNCGQPDAVRCGGLLTEAHAMVRTLLDQNGLDPAQGRELL